MMSTQGGTNVGNTAARVNAKWQTEWFGGIEGAGYWRLPDSTWSLVSRTNFWITQEEVRSRTIVVPSQAFLLSNDSWGVAAGPSTYADILTSQSGGVGSNPNSVLVGAEIRAQPLRTLLIPFLRDLTVTIGGFRSVGQATFIDRSFGKASAFVVSADFGWHFQF